MALFQFRAKRKRRKEDAERQKEREQRYRSERDDWRKIAKQPRDFASRRYLRGEGIEIGGLHRPLPLYEGAKVQYVDRFPTEKIRETYREVADLPQVVVDIVDDGETLGTIADASVDFVIANHMLEHTRNPIGTIETFLRVTRPGGIIYMAIPDKRHTFDRKREVTPFEHLREDYARGPEWSDRGHYEDWGRNVKGLEDEAAVRDFADDCMERKVNIHFHAWTYAEIVGMFLSMRSEFHFPFDVEAAIQNGHEVVMVLRKSGGAAAPANGETGEAPHALPS
ncbi:MAG TPA: methyltransferase domain-containing protein [Chthoniobacteraceae bacterium]|jgi:SAM-dependent methyltransferase|nr:methyltransferase domain-containing protein [Chthoniobacteraceae bacterium]